VQEEERTRQERGRRWAHGKQEGDVRVARQQGATLRVVHCEKQGLGRLGRWRIGDAGCLARAPGGDAEAVQEKGGAGGEEEQGTSDGMQRPGGDADGVASRGTRARRQWVCRERWRLCSRNGLERGSSACPL
jgi:hypothetical protein